MQPEGEGIHKVAEKKIDKTAALAAAKNQEVTE